MNPARPDRRPSRRALLRGGAAAGLTAATAAIPRSSPPYAGLPMAVAPSLADRPGAGWYPAHPSAHTVWDGPVARPVEFVVVHVAQETYADTVTIFQNRESRVSAHYTVRSADGAVAQCVRERDIAWHAGNWDYNLRSIGIEHEGWVDRAGWFTDAMYAASAALTAAVCDTWGIPRTREHIIGHSEVPGATHTDPGPHWDWDRYLGLVGARPAGR